MTIKHASLVLAALVVAACDSSGPDAPPQNQAPTISSIADAAIMANQAGPSISFAVNDEQPGNLALSVMSDNTEVVPQDGLLLSGSGTARQLTVTPVVDRVGDAYITVTATDTSGLTAGSTFLLTVNPEQKSMQQFTRDSFATEADGDPELVNAVDFEQDAEDDDFADLLAQ